MTYKTVDSVTNIDNAVYYPVEFLNKQNPPGFPLHCQTLKVGASVMLKCNETRLQIKAF